MSPENETKVIPMNSQVSEDQTIRDEKPIYLIETNDVGSDRFFRAPNDESAVFSFISLLSQSEKEEIKPRNLHRIDNMSRETQTLLVSAAEVEHVAKYIRRSDQKLIHKVTKDIKGILSHE